MGAVDVDASANQGSPRRAGYRRSAGSKRGEMHADADLSLPGIARLVAEFCSRKDGWSS